MNHLEPAENPDRVCELLNTIDGDVHQIAIVSVTLGLPFKHQSKLQLVTHFVIFFLNLGEIKPWLFI